MGAKPVILHREGEFDNRLYAAIVVSSPIRPRFVANISRIIGIPDSDYRLYAAIGVWIRLLGLTSLI